MQKAPNLVSAIPPSDPSVSIVITTKNSAATLDALLRTCVHQTEPRLEIIVIDNGSTDDTVAIAERFTDKVFQFGPERSAQRNYGVKLASAPYVLILDSDMELTPTVITDCLSAVRTHPNVKGLIIPEVSFGSGFWAECKILERSCYAGDDSIEAERFFDRESFFKVGGYDEIMTGAEDWDLALRFRKSFPTGRVATIIRHNESSISLWQSMKKKSYYAPGCLLFIKKYGYHALSQGNLIRGAYLRNWARLVRSPRLALGMFIMKLSESSALLFGLLWSSFSGFRRHNAA